METNFRSLLEKWLKNSCILDSRPKSLVLSKAGLSSDDLNELKNDFVDSCGETTLSVILSLKMMHIYFRVGSRSYDYRPHRGPFSRLSISDYVIGKSDRVEVLIRLRNEELRRLQIYSDSILADPRKTLGQAYPLSLREPDFTVRSHETRGSLTDNRLLDASARHNCLTWFTTAPLGDQGKQVLDLLNMTAVDIETECHSYIVALYKFLLTSADPTRVPGIVWWTNEPLGKSVNRYHSQPEILRDFYTV